MKPSAAQRAKNAGYLCAECAEKCGGRWPEGHRATAHPATCPLCGHVKPLCAWDDWNWPYSALNKEANRTRET